MARPFHLRDHGRLWLAVVLGVGAAASLWLTWPGELSPDGVWQLLQGRTGVYNAWHPPVMAWLLGLSDRISPGAPGFIVFDAALGFSALFAFAALAPRPRFLAVALAAALCATPLLSVYQGDVWKDVLFADATLAGFAALAWCARTWERPGARYGLAALACALFALAALARQNGLIVVVFGAGGLAVIAGLKARTHRPRVALGHGLAALATCLAIVGAASLALAAHGDHAPAQAEQLMWLQIWDLAGAVRADPSLDLATLQRQAPEAARFVRIEAAPAWTPVRIDPLLGRPGADSLDDDQPAIARQWLALIAARPGLYLRVRLADFRTMFAPPRPLACNPLFLGLDGPPEMLAALKLPPRDWRKIAWGRRYSLAFAGTPVFWHGLYAALALVLIALAARDLAGPSAPADRIAVIAMLLCALSFSASFLVIGVSCDYRYLYALDLAAMAALLHRAAVGFRRARLRY